MMSKKSPQLRFEGFTDDWELRKLGDEVKINGRIGFRGYTQADIVTKETGVLAYSPTNIVNNRLYRKQSDTYITKQKYRESPEIMVKNSDILFVKTGSTLGKSALVQSINYHATVNPQIVIIRSNELDEYFLSVILTSYNILKRINTIKIGGAIPTMTETELKKFPIQVPKSTEQKKIGSFFKQLDNTIALHQRKLDLLKEQKKGFLQKMFPKNGAKVPELRFAGFADDWEQRKLEELGNLNRGKSKHRPRNDSRLFGGEYPFIQTGDVAKAPLFLTEYSQTYSEFGIQQSKLWDIGTLLITIAANIADTTILGIKAAFPDSVIGFESTSCDVVFIKNYIDIQSDLLKRKAETSSQANLNLAKLKEMNLNIPKLKEQQKIGSFFKQLDDTIALHQRKLDLLKEQKKGFLQKMFV
ncbi:restriction endonuclease subunit S [Lactococcus lactis subsp. lactis]|uniref:restriction endonuclease subunit S n=1 Tax=Lactococcus lactis TaxID=1358 RepID=UPI00300DF970